MPSTCFEVPLKIISKDASSATHETTKKERPPNPQQNANFFSKITFAYIIPVFKSGLKKDFTEEDIAETLKDHSSRKLGEKLENAWRTESKVCRKPTLYRAIFRAFASELIAIGILHLLMEALRVSQPLALSHIIRYYSPHNEPVTLNEHYWWAGWLVMSVFLRAFLLQYLMVTATLLGMKLRVACSSLLYEKSLKLSKSALGEISTGQLTNLLANDVGRFDIALMHLHCIWICPVEMGIIIGLLYNCVGLTSTVGILLFIFFIPIQVYCCRLVAKYRANTALVSDERIRLMNEIISGIQVIKMYTWEKPFGQLVEIIRGFELHEIWSTAKVNAFLASGFFYPKIAIYIAILVFTLTGNIPTAGYIFTVTAFYNILREAVIVQFVRGVTEVSEACVSLKRLENFLAYDEVSNSDSKYVHNAIPNNSQKCGVKLENVFAKWCPTEIRNTLENINFQANSGELISIIGPVGSGKTSMLHSILNELQLQSGKLEVVGEISYAAQDPWIFSGNIQQNILMGKSMDIQRYKDVIKVCCLETDINLLPYGDKTTVGERGVSLSGGQRARINLARAVYADADIYLLDDPLSAVDPRVGNELFESCITKFLKNKCTILVTHQLQHLQNVNRIYLLEAGRIALSGSFETIRKSDFDFAKHLNEGKTETEVNDEITKTSGFVVNQVGEQLPIEVNEERAHGSVSLDVYTSYFNANTAWFCCICLVTLTSQISASGLDYFTLYWANAEQLHDFGVLKSRTTCVQIYSGIAFTVILFPLICWCVFFKYCLNSSSILHKNMLLSVLNSPMQFFNTTSSGRILNRFSKDLGVVDEMVPKSAALCLNLGFSILGAMVIVSLGNPWLLLITGFVLIVIYLLRLVYIPTGTGIKRLEGTCRSPVFAHINSSLVGLTTIRAFKVQHTLHNQFHDLQDLHSSALSLYVWSSRAFCFFLELVCCIYIATVTVSVLLSNSEQYGGTIGLAITQAVSIAGALQYCMREWTELDSQMTSVERMIEYINLEQEDTKNRTEPVQDWAINGQIEFVSVSLKYSAALPNAFSNISFHINPREKIGIVGRTGAGKSSLIWALFQLTTTEGLILIDGVDISKIPLHSLRSKLAIIPQQPILFSGSLRSNLDPFNHYADEELWSALGDVELKSVVSSFPSGLDYKIHEGGANFSVGQRQLICLARAIVVKNRILVLDEATANIDPVSDALIQKTIRHKFGDCTVLTIAHRLNTVIDSDKVIVMDAGKVIQFDHPYALLKDREGMFYSMVQQLGNNTTEEFIKIVENGYLERHGTRL